MALRDPQLWGRAGYARGFGNLSIGYLFLFDFHVDGFNMLPDFVGYLFMWLGLRELQPLHPIGQRLTSIALALVPISAPDIFASNKWSPELQPVFVLVGVGVSVATLYLTWHLCGVIVDVARAIQDKSLENSATIRRDLFVALWTAILAAGMLAWLLLGDAEIQWNGSAAALLAVSVIVLAVLAIALMAHLMWKVRNRLQPRRPLQVAIAEQRRESTGTP